jgi:hypothetical protein
MQNFSKIKDLIIITSNGQNKILLHHQLNMGSLSEICHFWSEAISEEGGDFNCLAVCIYEKSAMNNSVTCR